MKKTWEQLLGKVQVEGTNKEGKVKFYTALYHSFLQPRTFNDVDGSYPSFAGGKEPENSGDRDYFVDFSMWDTYRASHPLFNLLVPEKNADMMYSLLDKAEQGGWLPIFPCWNSYTSAMVGDHVIAVIADAYSKGIIDRITSYNVCYTKLLRRYDGASILSAENKWAFFPSVAFAWKMMEEDFMKNQTTFSRNNFV